LPTSRFAPRQPHRALAWYQPELHPRFPPVSASALPRPNLAFQLSRYFQQRRLQRVVPRFGVEIWPGDLQLRLDPEGRRGFALPFEGHLGGRNRRQSLQLLDLALN
jgi:hypothetical protein